MYKWISLATSADLAQLPNHITSEYNSDRVAKILSQGISDAVKGVLIEYNYIDKDYRSTYYNFYAKKGQYYRSDSVRLHFFDQTVKFDDANAALVCPDRELNDHYFGYMVLRPTGIATIGRTVLSPDIRKGAGRFLITADHKVHLLGYKLVIRGFPSMDQHVDISVCAHAACWSILRHYSERYNVHREYLVHEITMMAHEYNPGGLVPSKGLQIAHAERVFQEACTFPIHIARNATTGTQDHPFYRQLIAYVESGFPLFAAMHSRRHAVALVGYEWREPVKGHSGLRYAWDEVETLAVVDDNYLPYMSIPKSSGSPYAAEAIDAFIVALPEKVYYPADAVDRLAPALLKLGPAIGLPATNDTIIRYFITTGSSYRHFAREHASEFDPKLLQYIMTLPYAQFIWVVEFSTEEQWANGRVEARAVIDATASLREPMPLWLFHSRSGALIFDRKKVGQTAAGMGGLKLANTSHAGFSRMDRNLRPTQTK